MGPDGGPAACSTRTGLATGSSSGLFARRQKNCVRRPARSVRIGELFIERRQASEALSEFGRAVALRPGDAVALNNRGVALLMLGIREHAVTDFQEALKIDPCLADARRNLRLRVSDASSGWMREQVDSMEVT